MTAYRFEVFERLQVEMEHLTSLSAFRDELTAVYDSLNKSKPADAAVKINNLLNGVSRIQNGQPHPLLMICTLFICEESEDQSKWSEAEAQEKVQDWANVDVGFFLASAKRLFSRFMNDYATVFLNTLAEKQKSEVQ
jgi:hypothetical protein